MSDKQPKVVWGSALHQIRLVAIPATKYPYDTVFVFESCQRDSLGFESWRQVERITDSKSPIWQFIESMFCISEESFIGDSQPPVTPNILRAKPDKVKG
jgi:hypothetical protein